MSWRLLGALVVGGWCLSGCLPFVDLDPFEPPDPDPTGMGGDNLEPALVAIDVREWPPLGPSSAVVVETTDDSGLETVEIAFVRTAERSVSGTRARVTFRGSELGEGWGSAAVIVEDEDGAFTEGWINNLVVDLTPPELEPAPQVVRADGEGALGSLRFWVGDAWVLGWVELRVRNTRLVYEFPEGYPATFGDAWDWSLVMFPGEELPAGISTAEVTVSDAAGNLTSDVFELVVDGNPPEVSVVEPLPDAVVSGIFPVVVEATDPEAEPVWIEIRLGGSLVAQAAGPDARVELDALDFAPGETALWVVAGDRAGNRSEPVTVPLVIQ